MTVLAVIMGVVIGNGILAGLAVAIFSSVAINDAKEVEVPKETQI